LGVGEALSSRYSTVSSLLLVSTAAIIFQTRAVAAKKYRLPLNVCLVVISVLVLGNWAWGVHSMNVRHSQMKQIRACTKEISPSERCLAKTYPNTGIIKPRLEYLKQIHWGGY